MNAALPTDQRKYKDSTLKRVKETYTFAPRILPATGVLLQRKKEREARSSQLSPMGKSPIKDKLPFGDDKNPRMYGSTSMGNLRAKSTAKVRSAHIYLNAKQQAGTAQ